MSEAAEKLMAQLKPDNESFLTAVKVKCDALDLLGVGDRNASAVRLAWTKVIITRPLLAVLLLVPLATLAITDSAARAEPSYRVTQEGTGRDTLELVEPAFLEKASDAERDRYIRAVLFPKVQADAAVGRVPAVWEIGHFYLNGWGVPRDLQQADAAFRAGPESEQGRGLWKVGQEYRRTKEFAKAEVLLLESVHAGCKLAAMDIAHLAQGHLFGLRQLTRDPTKAEVLLQQLGAMCPDDADYLLGLLFLRYEQKQFAEAAEIAARVAPKLRDRPDDYECALDMQTICALRSGKLSELTPEKIREHLRNITDGSTWLLPVVTFKGGRSDLGIVNSQPYPQKDISGNRASGVVAGTAHGVSVNRPCAPP